jgi:hypothetical protein
MESRSIYYLSLDIDENYNCYPQLNTPLLSRVSVSANKNIDILEINNLCVNFKELEEGKGFVDKLIDICISAGISLNDENKNRLREIFYSKDILTFSTAATPKREFSEKIDETMDIIDNYGAIGLFTTANVFLYKFYSELINSEKGIEFYANLYNSFKDPFYKFEDVKETDIKQITSLDYTQKIAVGQAMRKTMVIQGPPGTGKSQVITNIIANAIHNNESVLFITEKAVASQVVENRLNILSQFCLPIFSNDNMNDRDLFYDKILRVLFEKNVNVSAQPSSIDSKIEEDFDTLKKISDLYKNQEAKDYVDFLSSKFENIPLYTN